MVSFILNENLIFCFILYLAVKSLHIKTNTRIVLSKIDEIVVNKQWRVYLDFGRTGSLSLQ